MAYDPEAYQRNKEKLYQRVLAYRKAHPEKVNEWSRTYMKKDSSKATAKKRREKTKDRRSSLNRESHLMRTYGITLKDKQEIWEVQGKVCACCARPIGLVASKELLAGHLDHNHETGKINGMLCNFCNRAKGYLQEDIKVVRKLVTYMEQYDYD